MQGEAAPVLHGPDTWGRGRQHRGNSEHRGNTTTCAAQCTHATAMTSACTTQHGAQRAIWRHQGGTLGCEDDMRRAGSNAWGGCMRQAQS